MERSIEKPENYTVVFGDMVYDGKKKQIECPPTTVNNKKMLPKFRVPMQEGEVVIDLVSAKAKYDKDENGKIIKIEYEDKDMAVGER